jgi:Cu(I)/Ag(I) efflux system membrane fusion protein
VFEGTITYVYPTLKAETRTVPVRVELANPGLLLKPAMFAQVELAVAGKGLGGHRAGVGRHRQRHAPDRADPAVGEGRFEPREVKLGAAATPTSKSSRV